MHAEEHIPRVSVLMSSYNTGPMIRETIDAILAQTFTDWELIIVDDCSTDDTPEIIRSYQDKRIRFERNPENLGISRTRNKAIDLARGEYIAATDHDDISLPTRLATQVAYLDAHPQAVMVATAAKELRNGRLRSLYLPEPRAHVIGWRLFTRCSIVHSSTCYRRRTLVEHGLRYRPEFHYAEDFVLFAQMSEIGDIVVLPDELVIYREFDTNASSRHTSEMNRNGQTFLQEFYLRNLGLALSDHQMALIWRLFNTRAPGSDETELLRGGELYAEALSRYLDRRPLNARQRSEIVEFACREWWQVSQAYCDTRGAACDTMSVYKRLPALSTWQPDLKRRTKAILKGLRARLVGHRNERRIAD